MQQTFKVTVLLFLAVLTAIACSKSGSNNTGGGGNNNNNNPACSGTPGTLFTAVRAIVSANCALSGCHVQGSATGGLNFSDNCIVVTNAARIKVRAVDQHGTSNQMPPPPSPGLTSSERQAITAWVAAGGRLTD